MVFVSTAMSHVMERQRGGVSHNWHPFLDAMPLRIEPPRIDGPSPGQHEPARDALIGRTQSDAGQFWCAKHRKGLRRTLRMRNIVWHKTRIDEYMAFTAVGSRCTPKNWRLQLNSAPNMPQPYQVRSSRHADHFTNSVAFDGWDLEYTQLSTGRYEAESKEVRFDGLQIYTENWNATAHHCGTARPNSYVFAIPYGMSGEGRFNGQHWTQAISVFRGETLYDALVPPMKLVVVCIARDTFSQYLETVEHASCDEWLKRGPRFIHEPVIAQAVIETFTALVDHYCTDPTELANAHLRDSMIRETLQTLAPLVAVNLAPTQFSFGLFNHTQIVRRAREYALSRIDEPIQIIDICRALGVSRRVLQYSFQDVLAVNPLTYFRLLRLNGARRDLINAHEKQVAVQDVLMKWGFWHPSRFSAEYKKMYQELPSETLRRVAPCAHAN